MTANPNEPMHPDETGMDRSNNLSSSAAIPLTWGATIRGIGPAVVVAAVVLGPGSITVSSRIGTAYGYSMGWVLVLTTLLMIGMTWAALVVGTSSKLTAGERLRNDFGRIPTILIGVCVFLIVALFQSSNNRALLLAGELFVPEVTSNKLSQAGFLVVFNMIVIAFFLKSRGVYRIVERMMLLLVGMMILCFGINAILGPLNWGGVLSGLVPSGASLRQASEKITGDLLALVGTTFSVAGAFYQCYLVRERGWTTDQLKRRWLDPVVGITTLGGLTLLIMSTAAASLHGRMEAKDITDLSALSASLRPTFGSAAAWIFASGIMAGAFSSFVGNALIGGTIMSDAIGQGATAEEDMPRKLTVAALLVGMAVSLLSILTNISNAGFIVLAQGLTTLGLPVMALSLGWLLRKSAPHKIFLQFVVGCGFLMSCYAASMTVKSLYEKFLAS